jgi:hypothetical protein
MKRLLTRAPKMKRYETIAKLIYEKYVYKMVEQGLGAYVVWWSKLRNEAQDAFVAAVKDTLDYERENQLERIKDIL